MVKPQTARRLLGAAALMLCWGASDCTWLVWHGHSPDRRVRVVVRERLGRQFVIRDGRPDPAFDGIAIEGLAFSDDGRHLAYPARRDGRWCVVLDGVPGPFWEGIGFVRFGPDASLPIYAALRKGRWMVVRNGVEGPALDSVLSESLVFSPNGRRLAYAGTLSGRSRVIMDGIVGPGFDGIGELAFSSDSGRLAYIARTESQAYLMEGTRAGPPFDEIREPRFDPPGLRLAYAAKQGGDWFVVLDGERGPGFEAVHSLTFSRSGERLAYVAVNHGRARIILDGIQGEGYDDIIPGSLAFSPDGGQLAFVATKDDCMAAVLNRKLGPWSESVSNLTFNPCTGSLMYVQRDRGASRWIRDGVPGPDWEWIGQTAFGPGCRVGYIAQRADGMRIIVDGREFLAEAAVDGTLVFSDDGNHWACLAGDVKLRKLFVIVDSPLNRRPFDWDELVGEIMRHPAGVLPLSAAVAGLRRWVKAELELAISTGAGERAR